jgi:Glycosyl transferase family 2
MAAETVTIGVPVFRGELFLEETLRCVQAQTHREMRVLISLDGPQPNDEKICQPFLKDSRFELIVQPRNLGWVGNINWLMSRVDSPYWVFQQQDDLIDPHYLETLVAHARTNPQAAVVYCDIEAFGAETWKYAQPSVTGSPPARQLALLYSHHPAVALRGLTRLDALRQAGGIPTNEIENFSCDTTWMSAVARWGELLRVPAQLYRKRYHGANTHMKWWAWPIEKRRQAWVIHCADMLEQAMKVDAAPQERRLLWLAAVARLAPTWMQQHLPVADVGGPLLNDFLMYVRSQRNIDLPGLLDSDWNDIEQWTTGFSWRPAGLRHQLAKIKKRLRGPREALFRLLPRR